MDLKRCGKCKLEKPLSEFHFKNKERGVYRDRCKDCSRLYHREHYDAHKADYIARAKATVDRIKAKVMDYLLAHPCVDCGEPDPVVLDFDHVIGEKRSDVSTLITYGSWNKLLEEIAKCVVRCSNCHRKKTAKDKGWYRRV